MVRRPSEKKLQPTVYMYVKSLLGGICMGHKVSSYVVIDNA